jgi:hypothetical protein
VSLLGEVVVIGLGISTVINTTLKRSAKVSVVFIFLLASS